MNYNETINDRLKNYASATSEDEADALKEILQEIILNALADAHFFDRAAFHGGTSLRIIYGLRRFSEDLDFILKEPDSNFHWQPFFDAIVTRCELFGIYPELRDKSKVDNAVKKMFFKDNSIGKILDVNFHHHPGKKLMIKLEIDVEPPAGSDFETKFLAFPLDYAIDVQNIESNFANKLHAILCRKYEKGRDWYDFLWYLKQQITPNFTLLSNAANQQGPWAGQNINANPEWLLGALEQKINSTNWDKAMIDVKPFLRGPDRDTLKLWESAFFQEKRRSLAGYLKDKPL